jgi:hypothetical protein
MPTITVVRPFMLQLDPKEGGLPEKKFFAVGVHDVTDEVAGHWYTLLHLEGYKEPPKGPGTAEFQVAQQVAEQSPAEEPNPADPVQPAPDASTAPRAAIPPPSAERSVPRHAR